MKVGQIKQGFSKKGSLFLLRKKRSAMDAQLAMRNELLAKTARVP